MVEISIDQPSAKIDGMLSPIDNCATVAISMLRLIVREVAERAGFSNPYELSQKAQLPYETCRALWNGESKMIALKTLERLCQVLEVRPAQLFEYEAEPFRTEEAAPQKSQSKRKS